MFSARSIWKKPPCSPNSGPWQTTPPTLPPSTPSSRLHHEWLGKVAALIQEWNSSEGVSVRLEIGYVSNSILRSNAVSTILSVLYRAIADLQNRLPTEPARALDRVLSTTFSRLYAIFLRLRHSRSLLLIRFWMSRYSTPTWLQCHGTLVFGFWLTKAPPH